MDCPTHEKHEIKCQTNKNDIPVNIWKRTSTWIQENRKKQLFRFQQYTYTNSGQSARCVSSSHFCESLPLQSRTRTKPPDFSSLASRHRPLDLCFNVPFVCREHKTKWGLSIKITYLLILITYDICLLVN